VSRVDPVNKVKRGQGPTGQCPRVGPARRHGGRRPERLRRGRSRRRDSGEVRKSSTVDHFARFKRRSIGHFIPHPSVALERAGEAGWHAGDEQWRRRRSGPSGAAVLARVRANREARGEAGAHRAATEGPCWFRSAAVDGDGGGRRRQRRKGTAAFGVSGGSRPQQRAPEVEADAGGPPGLNRGAGGCRRA
jgi:hypothetical protein